jgi:hypothetical protein
MRARSNGIAITVIGAGPAYTDRAGAVGASYLVTHGDTKLVLDLGQGTFARLAGIVENIYEKRVKRKKKKKERGSKKSKKKNRRKTK